MQQGLETATWPGMLGDLKPNIYVLSTSKELKSLEDSNVNVEKITSITPDYNSTWELKVERVIIKFQMIIMTRLLLKRKKTCCLFKKWRTQKEKIVDLMLNKQKNLSVFEKQIKFKIWSSLRSWKMRSSYVIKRLNRLERCSKRST